MSTQTMKQLRAMLPGTFPNKQNKIMSVRPEPAWPFPTVSEAKNKATWYPPALTRLPKKRNIVVLDNPNQIEVIKQKDLTTDESNIYVKSHGIVLPNGQVFLTKALKVFKKVYTDSQKDAIANLIIPKGALVNLAKPGSKKMRASVAVCHSIHLVGCGQKPIDFAYSSHEKGFRYAAINGRSSAMVYLNKALDQYYSARTDTSWFGVPRHFIITPVRPFATVNDECDSGIHFFVESNAAQQY